MADIPEFKIDTKGGKSLGSGIIGGVVGSAVTQSITTRGAEKRAQIDRDTATHMAGLIGGLMDKQADAAKSWHSHLSEKGHVTRVEAGSQFGRYSGSVSQPDTDITGEVKASDVTGSAPRKTHRTGRTDKPTRYAVRPARGGGAGEAGLTKKSVAAAKKAAKKDQ